MFEMNGEQMVRDKPKNSKVTGPRAATAAAKTLINSKATRTEKSAAGSALSQTPPKGHNNNSRVTGTRAATAASKTLTNSKATRTEKSAAGSTLSQTPSRNQRAVTKRSSNASSVNVGVVKPTVKKENRAALVSARAAVRTKKSVDFVKVVRGR